ncbi:hypothetical protein EJB05_40199, partial [Eragrostis curvula]
MNELCDFGGPVTRLLPLTALCSPALFDAASPLCLAAPLLPRLARALRRAPAPAPPRPCRSSSRRGGRWMKMRSLVATSTADSLRRPTAVRPLPLPARRIHPAPYELSRWVLAISWGRSPCWSGRSDSVLSAHTGRLAPPSAARRAALRSTPVPVAPSPLPEARKDRVGPGGHALTARGGDRVSAGTWPRRARKGVAERGGGKVQEAIGGPAPSRPDYPSLLSSAGASKMPQVMVVARNFMDMVAALPREKLLTLYDSVFICEAVLRSLPPLAKKYVLQMLYVSAPVAASAMEEWVLDEYATKHKVAIDRLIQLRVFDEERNGRKVSYKMNDKFQKNMQNYLVKGGSLPSDPLQPNVTGRLPTLAELEDYALEQWESFLLQLINSSQVEKGTSFSPAMMRTFQRGLLSSREGEVPKLTENGFQFLLMETNAQLWYIMREYISSAEERGVDPSELISFLLELSFHTQGAAYSLTPLSPVKRSAIKDLASLGLVKLQQGFVVVETNFRMYAYSTSKLHCEILRLFSRVEYQLPNLIAGAITKESIYGAFENGITAEQIISFLQQNAHPRVADKIPTVPENVTDQIRLWETDRNRVEMVPSHLYEDFPSRELFEQCCDHARDNGYLLWEDPKKMRLIVRGEFHPEMREFLRRQR